MGQNVSGTSGDNCGLGMSKVKWIADIPGADLRNSALTVRCGDVPPPHAGQMFCPAFYGEAGRPRAADGILNTLSASQLGPRERRRKKRRQTDEEMMERLERKSLRPLHKAFVCLRERVCAYSTESINDWNHRNIQGILFIGCLKTTKPLIDSFLIQQDTFRELHVIKSQNRNVCNSCRQHIHAFVAQTKLHICKE